MSPQRDTLIKRIDRLTRRARAYLVWERFAPVLAIGVAATLIFMAGSFAGIWERIGDPWRLLALFAALALLGRAIWNARAVKFPNRNAAARRVEQDSGLSHRPFDTVRDSAAKTGQADINLWDEHARRAAGQAAAASDARLRPALAPMDKYYLRYAIPAIVVLSLMLGTGDSFERLRRSLTPGWISAIDPSAAKFDAWIDPPDYTGRPPVYFKSRTKLEAPEGSELVARVNGIKSAPRLLIVENGKSRRVPVTRLGPTSFEARTILSGDAKARWRIGATPKTWRIDVLQDTAPDVKWTTDPIAGKRDTLEFAYDLTDDFGATSLVLSLQRANDIARMGKENAPVEIIELPLGAQTVRRAQNKPESLNLTKHIWASEKVVATLRAKDFKGQIGTSEPRTFIVPDKIFISKLAKAAVENRALLLAAKDTAYAPLTRHDPRIYPVYSAPVPEDRIERAPAQVQRAAALIDIITDSPVGAFKDPVVYLGLKNVQSRLEQAREITDLDGAPEDLWLIAMRAEYGPLGNAKEAMMATEEALRDGIARRARKREIDTLFTRYNDAVDRYMQYLMENAEQVDEEGGGGPSRNADEIQKLLDAIEEANRLGDTEGARRALAQLAELLENMQIQLAKGGEGGDGEPDDGLSEDVKEAIEDLADVIGEQRELQDETREAQREQEEAAAQNGQDGQQSGGEQAGAQSGQGQSSGGQQAGNQSGSSSGGGDGNQAGQKPGDNPAATPEQLAKNQGALQSAIDALEKALKEGGTDLTLLGPQGDGPGGSKPGEQGAGGVLPSEDPNAPPGAGGSDDPDAPNGIGGGGSSDDPNAPQGQGGASGESGEDTLTLSPQEALDAARRAMAESQAALEGQAFADANAAQAAAIEALKKAAEGLISTGNQGQSGEGSQAGGNDPFGRNAEDGQGTSTGEVEIPGVTDRQRARDLIEELRRRAADQERSQEELDYLERLLERF